MKGNLYIYYKNGVKREFEIEEILVHYDGELAFVLKDSKEKITTPKEEYNFFFIL